MKIDIHKIVEIQANSIINLPKNLEEFIKWEYEKPVDGFKYEWNNGKIVSFEGLKMRYLYIYSILMYCFVEKGYPKKGTLVSKPEIILNETQLRRPDIAYLTKKQIYDGREGIDFIPEFVVEVISKSDN